MNAPPLPYLTPEFPGIGGAIKRRAEDFFVQEVPLYEPSGEGEHIYCEIQKVGLTTFEAVSRLGRALRVPSGAIGYAGMKDANAVTRQVLSVAGPGVTPERVMTLGLPDVQVLWAARHGNKLRLGHLRGNRFAIKVRDVEPTSVLRLKPVVETLQSRGMPNYFGEQRFGRRGDNDLLGAMLVRGDDEGLLRQLLGRPDPENDPPRVAAARAAYDAGNLAKALGEWPGGMERAVLARLIKTGQSAAAVRSVDQKIRRLWVSALQSRMFNDVVAARLHVNSIDRLMDEDLAYKHENGARFRVESAAAEQPRSDAFDISPTGPLLGCKMTQPGGEPGRIEESAFAVVGLAPADFRSPHLGKVRGARPLRVRPESFELAGGVDEHGSYVTAAFTLPAGSFATVLLRELTKTT